VAEHLTLYGRSYCHLCDDMLQALQNLQGTLAFSVKVQDVDADPLLEAKYGELVPVLLDGQGREICHYFLDIGALRSRLAVK
jgi:hypothetical protein